MPWELLYDNRRGDYFVFDKMISIVRYIRLHTAPPVLHQSRFFKVLALVASPTDQLPLDWQGELALLKDGLRGLIESHQVELVVCEHTTPESLHEVLLANAPDVVHFIGHAEYDQQEHQGSLILEDEHGKSVPLQAANAARALRRYGTNLVILNACDTAKGAWAGLGPALVRAEIPAVVAMQWPVEDRAATSFSRAFYRSLASGKTIDECMAEARMGVSATHADPGDWAAPVLFLRSASGQLWTNDTSSFRQQRQGEDRAPRAGGLPQTTAPARPLPLASEDGFYFKTRGPLLSPADQALIVERPELRRALRIAQQPSVTQYIALLSPRQTGKTTVLLQLMSLLQGLYACTFIDLSVLRTQDAKACFRFVAFRLISEFRHILGSDFALPETQHVDDSVEFLEFLDELARAVPVPRIILLIDEVGALTPEVSDSFFNTLRTVFTQGRGLANHLSKYLFVFSGAVDLYGLTFGTNSPLNICEKLFLRDFTPADVRQIVSQFRHLDIPVSKEAPERIHELAGGHPYLTLRLCALLEHPRVSEVTAEAVDRAATQMLVEDDNIRHVIHELEKHPLARRRLYGILVEGRRIPFSRNDPVLASLEMIGAIRAVQPCEVRNRLYEQALRQYYAQGTEGLFAEATTQPDTAPAAEVDTLHNRLELLRAEALDAQGHYKPGKAWETFAAALFSMVPAFSVYADGHADPEQMTIVLGINGSAPGGSYWDAYQPAILVEGSSLRQSTAEKVVAELVAKASRHGSRLLFLMACGGTMEASERARFSGSRGDTYLVVIEDAEIATLLQERRDFEPFLRDRVLDARLRNI